MTLLIACGLMTAWLRHQLSDHANVRLSWEEEGRSRSITLAPTGIVFVERRPIDTREETVIPYWQMIIPLTLLSAYLLISKPRQQPK